MVKRLSERKRGLFETSYVLGDSVNVAASKTGISDGFGHTIAKALHERIPSADEAIEFFRDLKRKNISPDIFVAAAKFLEGLLKEGYDYTKGDVSGDFAKISQFIQEFGGGSNASEPDTLGSVVAEIHNTSKELGVPISELEPRCVELSQQLDTLNHKITNTKQQLSETEAKRKKMISEMQYTQDLLERYEQLALQLDQKGINIREIESLENALDKLHECGHDPNTVAQRLQKEESLSQRFEQLKENLHGVESDLKSNKETVTQQERQIQSNAILIGKLENLRKVGITYDDLVFLHGMISDIASENKTKPDSAWKKFVSDSKTKYDSVLGFEKDLGLVSKQYKALEKKYSNMKSEYETQKTQYQNTIRALESKRQGLEKMNHSLEDVAETCKEKLDQIYTEQSQQHQKRADDLHDRTVDATNKIRDELVESLNGMIKSGLESMETVSGKNKKELEEMKHVLQMVGKYDALIPLYKILDEKPVDDHVLKAALAVLLSKAGIFVHDMILKRAINSVIIKLESDLRSV